MRLVLILLVLIGIAHSASIYSKKATKQPNHHDQIYKLKAKSPGNSLKQQKTDSSKSLNAIYKLLSRASSAKANKLSDKEFLLTNKPTQNRVAKKKNTHQKDSQL